MFVMEQIKIGTYISERRKALGLRQADLGAKLSYSVQAISKMEKGQSSPAGALLPALCNALGISLEDLFARNEKPEKANPVPPFDGLTFAQNISFLRIREGISQYALAKALHISKRSVANYERGVSVPSFDVVEVYLKHYNLTPSALFNSTLAPKPATHPSVAKRIIWGSFGALAIAAIIVGATSPLWLKKTSDDYNQAYVPETSSSSSSSSNETSSSSSSETVTIVPFEE
jgi:transcriptional regulator with XRE-family HTH domain